MNFTNTNQNISIYFKEIRDFKNLTLKDERILFARIADGDDSAVCEIFNRMARLAVATAKIYTCNPDLLQDLIQEANCGVLEAIRKFDPSLGYRFSSYARWWMKAYINKYIGELNTVHPANSTITLLAKKISLRFYKENQREITEYELMEKLEEMGQVVTDISAILSVKVDSLSDVFGDDDRSMEDSLEVNEKASSFNDSICVEDNTQLADDIARMLDRLTPRERQMVKWKFGIGCYRQMEYDEIARKWSAQSGDRVMSAERCRQIVVAAVKKMRNM